MSNTKWAKPVTFMHLFTYVYVTTTIKGKGYDFEREGESGRSGRARIKHIYI